MSAVAFMLSEGEGSGQRSDMKGDTASQASSD